MVFFQDTGALTWSGNADEDDGIRVAEVSYSVDFLKKRKEENVSRPHTYSVVDEYAAFRGKVIRGDPS